MAQPAGHIVGRAAELESLDQALAELERRRSGALELLGEPGMGKTRLLAELEARADGRRFLALTGSASELEHELPFGVFVDALDDYVLGLEPRSLASLDDETRTELANVLPSLAAPADQAAAGLRDERYRTHRAVKRLLEALAEKRPLVLILDDLHWADSGSLELIGALLRRPPAAPVLIALALRPRQIPDRLAGALERAHDAGALTRVEVGPLSTEEARELLGPSISRGVAAALSEESGGNPFYLQQLARSVRRQLAALPTAPDLALAEVDVPDAVGAALGEELALLPGGVRRALEGAAVAGDPFEPELAAAAAAVPEATVM
jgi:predicted ATPase